MVASPTSAVIEALEAEGEETAESNFETLR
jgi:hypothetical protein